MYKYSAKWRAYVFLVIIKYKKSGAIGFEGVPVKIKIGIFGTQKRA